MGKFREWSLSCGEKKRKGGHEDFSRKREIV
jgi:hypothetical protein